MDELALKQLLDSQRNFFNTGTTLNVKWRIQQLKKLRNGIITYEEKIKQALFLDLEKSSTESYLCEIGAAILEINEMIRGLRHWARPENHLSGFMCFPSMRTKVYKMPYGTCLIISPYNFPFLLSLGVLAACISGGNTAIIKVSSKTTNSSATIRSLIEEIFPQEYISVIEGGHDIADLCLAQRFDKIFYTGSPNIGRRVLHAAAENLTPVALELGGENGNWAIVRKDANLRDAARKIAFIKACNSGQICIDVNQVAVASEICEPFLAELKREFIRQLGVNAYQNPDYPKLITRDAYDKCSAMAEEYANRIVFGGVGDPIAQKFNPTLIYPVQINEDIVHHELFSPLLPIVPFEDSNIDLLLNSIANREHPLALYLFTSDLHWAKQTMASMQYGGGCINEVCIHMMVKGVPFNGTGHSGMGAYHGRWGFQEFTHPSTVLIGSCHMNLSLREHPYSGKGRWKERLIRLAEK